VNGGLVAGAVLMGSERWKGVVCKVEKWILSRSDADFFLFFSAVSFLFSGFFFLSLAVARLGGLSGFVSLEI
jgi:MFS superfamily sulfate permease-like transporter